MFSATLATVSMMSSSVRPEARACSRSASLTSPRCTTRLRASLRFEDGVDLLCRSSGMTRVSDIFLGEADFAADEGVRAEAVGAHVTLGDDEGDLLPDLG